LVQAQVVAAKSGDGDDDDDDVTAEEEEEEEEEEERKKKKKKKKRRARKNRKSNNASSKFYVETNSRTYTFSTLTGGAEEAASWAKDIRDAISGAKVGEIERRQIDVHNKLSIAASTCWLGGWLVGWLAS